MKKNFWPALFFAFFATLPLWASVWFSSAPSSVNHGAGYYVEATASMSGWGGIELYRNGSYSSSNSGYGYFSVGLNTSDSGPQTIEYHAVSTDWDNGYYTEDTWAYVTINPPANSPPAGACDYTSPSLPINGTLSGNGWAVDSEMGAPVTRVDILIDGNDVGDATLGDYRGDVATAYGRSDFTYCGWHFSLGIGALSPGSHTVSFRAWDNQGASTTFGSRSLSVVNNAPTINLLSPAAQTININTTLTITSNAADADGDITTHNLDIQRPDGSWNWGGGFAYGEPYMGGPIGSASNSTRSANFTFNQAGTWYVRSWVADGGGNSLHSATVAITVTANVAPTVSWHTAPPATADYGSIFTARAQGNDTDGNLVAVQVDVSVDDGAWGAFAYNTGGNGYVNVSDSNSVSSGASGATRYRFRARAVDSASLVSNGGVDIVSGYTYVRRDQVAPGSITPTTLAYGGTFNNATFTANSGTKSGAASWEYRIASGAWTALTATPVSVPAVGTALGVRVTYAGDTYWKPSTSAEQGIGIAKGPQAAAGSITPTSLAYGTTFNNTTFTAGSGPRIGTPSWEYRVASGAWTALTSTPVSVPAVGTALGVRVTYSGDANWDVSTPSAEQPVTIVKGTQVAAGAITPTTLAYGLTFNNATFTAGSGTRAGTPSWEYRVASGAWTALTATPVSVPAVGTALGVRVTYGGDSNWNASAASAEQPVTIVKGTQTLPATITPTSVAYGTTFNNTTFSAGSGQRIGTPSWEYRVASGSWTALTSTAVSVPVVGTAVGVRVTYGGDSNWNSAVSAEQPITVVKGTQVTPGTITPTSLAYGTTFNNATFAAATGTKAGTASWEYRISAGAWTALTSTPVSVPAVGTPLGVRVTYSGDANWNISSASNEQVISITKGAQAAAGSITPTSLAYGTTFNNTTFTAGSGPRIGTPSWEYRVASGAWTALTSTPVSVPAVGTALGVRVTYSGDSNWDPSPASSEQGITITKGTQVTPGTITPVAIAYGTTFNNATFTAATGTKAGTASWEYRIAAGAWTALTSTPVSVPVVGTALGVRVTYGGDSNWNASTVSAEQPVTINKGAQVTPGTITPTSLAYGTTFNNTTFAAAIGTKAGTASWEYRLSSGGTWTALTATAVSVPAVGGYLGVRVTYGGDANWNASATSAEQVVTIIKGTQVAPGTITPTTLAYGSTFNNATFSAATGTKAGTATWEYRLSSGGTWTALTASAVSVPTVGSYLGVRVTYAGDANWNASAASAELVVGINKGAQVTPAAITPTTLAYGTTFNNATFTAATGTKAGTPTWEYRLSSGGTWTALTATTVSVPTVGGYLGVRVTYGGDANWNASAASNEQVITITKGTQVTPGTITPASLAYGTTFNNATFTAGTGTKAGTATWEYRLSSGGTWTALTAATVGVPTVGGYLGVRVTYSGDANWNASTTSNEQVITINPGAQAAAGTITPTTLAYGTTFNNATFTAGSGPRIGAATWEYRLSSGGTWTALTATAVSVPAAGSYLGVRVIYGGDANWSASPASAEQIVTINVGTQVTPGTITPTALAYGATFNNATFTAGSGTKAGAATWEYRLVSGGTWTALTATAVSVPPVGSYLGVRVTYAGDSNWSASAPSAEQVITIAKLAQDPAGTITPVTLAYGTTFNNATFTAGSGPRIGTPTWEYRLSAGGTWTALTATAVSVPAVGSYLGVRVSYSGDATWDASAPSNEQVVTIVKGTQVAPGAITPATVGYGTTFNNATFVAGSGTKVGTATWEYRLSAGGTWTALTATTVSAPAVGGYLGVRVTYAGDSNWNPSATSAEQVITINQGAQAAPGTITPTTLAYGTTFNNATFTAGSGPRIGTPTWEYRLSAGGTWTALTATTVSVPAMGSYLGVRVTYSGDSNWGASAPSAEQVITIAKGTQVTPGSITPTSLAYGTTFNNATFTAATGTKAGTASWEYRLSSGGTWTALTATAVSVPAVGGYLGVRVTYGGDANWNASAASNEQVVTITKGTQVTPGTLTPTSRAYGTTFNNTTFSAALGTKAGTASWEYRLSSGGTWTALTATAVSVPAVGGYIGVRVTYGGDANWNASATSTEQVVTIVKGTQVTPGTITPASLAYGTTFNNATFAAGTGTKIGTASWEYRLSSGGTWTALTATAVSVPTVGGYIGVRVTYGGDANWNASATSTEQVVGINPGAQVAPGGITPTALSYGTTFNNATFTAATGTKAGTPTWEYRTSSGGAWTALTATGVPVPAAGSYLGVRVTYGGDTNWTASAASSEQLVTINPGTQVAPGGITPTALAYGTTFNNTTFSAGSGTKAGTAAWEYRLSSSGSWTALTATAVSVPTVGSYLGVRVTYGGDANWSASAASSEQVITVNPGTQAPADTITPTTLSYGATFNNATFTAGGGPRIGTPAWEYRLSSGGSWTALTASTVSVPAVGGYLGVRVTYSGDANWSASAASAEQVVTIIKGAQVAPGGITPTSRAYGTTFNNATFAAATGTKAGTATWEYRLSSSGSWTTLTASTVSVPAVGGYLGVRVTYGGDANWNASAASTEQVITVTQGSQVVPGTITPTTRAYGTTFNNTTFSAGSGTKAGTAAWEYRLSSSGSWTALTATAVTVPAVGGYIGVRVTYGGDANWSASTSAEQVVTITKGTQVVPGGITPTSRAYGTTFNNATFTAASGTKAGTATWEYRLSSSGSWTALTASTVSIPTVGSYLGLRVTYSGDANWNASTSAEQVVTITKGTQVTPAGITPTSRPAGSTINNATFAAATGTKAGTATWEYRLSSGGSWTTLTASAVSVPAYGSYLGVRVTYGGDANWNASTPSNEQLITILGAPTVTLTAPTNGTSIPSPGVITLTATASDTDGTVTKVEFLKDGIVLGEDLTSPYSLDVTLAYPGTYAITARATDNLSLTTTSAASNLTVTVPTPVFPFLTGFEAASNYVVGTLEGQSGWTATGVSPSAVSTVSFATGARSALLPGNTTPATLTRTFPTLAANSIVFADVYWRPRAGTDEATSPKITVLNAAQVALVQSGTTGYVRVFNGNGVGGGSWQASPASVALDAGGVPTAWVRITLRLDYATHKWDLFVNGAPAAVDVNFTSNTQNTIGALAFTGHASAATYVDDVLAAFDNPVSADADRDGMPDSWETPRGLNTAINDRNTDLDGDGISNILEYLRGTDPSKTDSDGDGLSDGQEILDGTNPALADTDGDGMPDGWEKARGLNPLSAGDGAADTDGDGISNAQEFINGGDPNNRLDAIGMPGGYQAVLPTPAGTFQGLKTSDWTLTPLPAP